MRPFICTRIHRRFIVKYFGSLTNLILWTLCVSLTVYFLDNYFFKINTSSIANSIVAEDNIIKNDDTINVKKEKEKIIPKIDLSKNPCGISEICSKDEFSYHILSGQGRDAMPIICFNGLEVFTKSKANGKRGINMAIINDKTKQVEDIRTFDTYEDDKILLRYLQLGIEKNHIMMVATFDEASLHLSTESKVQMSSFGSNLISKLEFRDSFVMIGQKGMKAIEQLITRQSGETHAATAEIKGCLTIPIGKSIKSEVPLLKAEKDINGDLPPVAQKSPENIPVSNVKLGAISPNCEVEKPCDKDSYSVRLFTGKENIKLPKICFNGHYVIDDNLNGPSRGFNIMTYDEPSGVILKVQHFDTYNSPQQSVELHKFLESLGDNEIILSVAHDEVQTNLKKDAIDLLVKFGSSFISSIAFRDVWVFVGRKNMNGFTPYEDIESGGKESWPFPIDKRFCIKKNFLALPKKIDLSEYKNMDRRNFCKKYDGYEDFCAANVVDEHPKAEPQNIKELNNHRIYKIPIIIIPGLSHVSTLMQFQALMKIPGIDSNYITVMYDKKFEESGILAKLFKFPVIELPSSTKYVYLIEKALEEIWKKFDNDYVIILEEEIIPTADFLYFHSQFLDILDNDETLVGISAFNENGFEGVSSNVNIAYRGRTFPGFGFLLKKSFYNDKMKDKMKSCCMRRAWYSWFFEGLGKKEMIFPEVSRVSRRQFLGLTENAALIREYFNRPRVNSNGEFKKISNVESLLDSKYDKEFNDLIHSSEAFSFENLGQCISASDTIKVPSTKENVFSIYFEQENENDETVFGVLSKCFGLFYSPGSKLKGTHKNTLRFTYKENIFFFVGMFSPYFKEMPKNYKLLTKDLSSKL